MNVEIKKSHTAPPGIAPGISLVTGPMPGARGGRVIVKAEIGAARANAIKRPKIGGGKICIEN